MSADEVSSSSELSWMSSVSSGGQQFSFSPDETMTRPSLTDMGYSNPPAGQSQTYFQDPEEMMEVPYVGQFTWQDEQDFVGSSPGSASGSQHKSGTSSQPGMRLTPEDIAGFMQHNPVDEKFRRPNS